MTAERSESCSACRADPRGYCNPCGAQAHVTGPDEEDRLRARVAELEWRLAEIAGSVCPGYTEGPPEEAIAMMQRERESLVAALEAEKARAERAEAELAAIRAKTPTQRLLSALDEAAAEAIRARGAK
jgi:hypothetical protein